MAHVEYEMKPLKITANLISELAGDAPYLDSLLEYHDRFLKKSSLKIKRGDPIEHESGTWNLPLATKIIGGHRIYCCSDPILSEHTERIEYFTQNLDTTYASRVIEKKVNISKLRGEFKSKRIPVRLRQLNKIVYFANGNKERIEILLNRVHSIGDLRKQGYGIISGWDIEQIKHDNSLCAKSKNQNDSVLMKTVPYDEYWVTRNIGWRESYGGYSPPYWHPDRQGRIMVPC